MSIMTPKNRPLSSFTKGRDKYTDAQVAALIEDLDLIPGYLITPTIVKIYREELRAQADSMRANMDSIRYALEYTENFLQSAEGLAKTRYYQDLFSGARPVNR